MNYGCHPYPPVVSPPASSHFVIGHPPPSYSGHVFPSSQFLPPGSNQVPPYPRQVFTPPPTQLLSWSAPSLAMPPLHGHIPPPPPPSLAMPPLRMHAVQPMLSGVTYNTNPVFRPHLHQLNIVQPEPYNRHMKGKVDNSDEDWESIFKRAASRNGITVEESPRQGKSPNIVSELENVVNNKHGTISFIKQAQEDVIPSSYTYDKRTSFPSGAQDRKTEPPNYLLEKQSVKIVCQEVSSSLTKKFSSSSNQFSTSKETETEPRGVAGGNNDGILKDTALFEEPSDQNSMSSIPKNVSLSEGSSEIYVSDNEFESEAENCDKTSGLSKEMSLAVQREFSVKSESNSSDLNTNCIADTTTKSEKLSEVRLESEVEMFVNDIVAAAVESLLQERKERTSNIECESSIIATGDETQILNKDKLDMQHTASQAESDRAIEDNRQFKMWLNMYCVMNCASDALKDVDEVNGTIVREPPGHKLTSQKESKEEYSDGRPCSLEEVQCSDKTKEIPDTLKVSDVIKPTVLGEAFTHKLTSKEESEDEYSDSRPCSLEEVHCSDKTLDEEKLTSFHKLSVPKLTDNKKNKKGCEDYCLPHSQDKEDKIQASVCSQAQEYTSASNEDSSLSKIDSNPNKELNVDCQPFVPKSTSSNKQEEIDDTFVKLALREGIKVGNIVPAVNNKCVDAIESKPEDEFEKLALKSGIRVGGPHLREQPQVPNIQNKQDSKSKPKDIYDEIFEKFASKNGIKIGSGEHQQDLSRSLNEPGDPVCIIPVEGPDLLYYDRVIPHRIHTYSSPIKPVEHYLVQTGSDTGTFSKAQTTLSFEELAKNRGIKTGVKRIDVQCQTLEHTVNSQESQTFDLIKIKSTSVQVDVDQEAFKNEFHKWMQEELELLDSTAASFRELYCSEVDARTEAERRLAVEMDENVKSQRNTKMIIDELKEQLQGKDDIIEKFHKELKSVKKHKDNEIKRLTKDNKQKEEEIDNIKHESKLKDVAIENINEISKDQTVRIEDLEEQLKEVENAMEDEKKKARELLKFETPQQPSNKTSQWQVVRHGASIKQAVKRFPTHIDCLSEFDEDFEVYTRKNSSASLESDIQDSACYSEVNNHKHSSTEGMDLSKSQSLGNVCNMMTRERMGSVSNITNTCNRSEGGSKYIDISTEMNRIIPSCSNNAITRSQPIQVGSTQSNTSTREPLIGVVSHTEAALPLSSNNSHLSSTFPNTCNGPLPTTVGSHPSPVGSFNATLAPSGATAVPSVHSVPGTSFGHPPGISDGQPTLPGATPFTSFPTGSFPNFISSYDAPVSHSVATGLQAAAMGPGVSTFPTASANGQATSRSATLGPTKASRKPSNKFSTFDKLMEALRNHLPTYTRPELMVYLKKAKESFGTNGFKGKEISEIVTRVSQIVHQV